MKIFIKSVVLFLMFSAIFYIVGLIALPRYFKKNLNYRLGSYGNLYSRLKDVKSAKNINLLFLGSSHVYRGLDTRIFDSAGFRSFNLGSSAQSPIQTEQLTREYLTRINPEIVVYDVNLLTFSNDGVESSLDLLANNRITPGVLGMTLKSNNVKVFNTFIYAAFRQSFNLDRNFHEPLKRGKDTYIKGGFIEREVEYYQHKKYTPVKMEIRQDQLASFDETLKYIRRAGKKVILIQVPSPPGLYNSYTNRDAFDSIIKSRNYPYYNFNKIIQLDDSLHFYDYSHLNQNGVKIFNSKLIEVLKSDTTLK